MHFLYSDNKQVGLFRISESIKIHIDMIKGLNPVNVTISFTNIPNHYYYYYQPLKRGYCILRTVGPGVGNCSIAQL